MTRTLDGAALARRVEAGWAHAGAESARSYGRSRPEAGVAVEAVGGGVAAYFGPGSPLSQAQGLGLDGPVSDDDLGRLEAFFDARAAATAVEVASLADPGLLPALSRRGYTAAEQTHVLVRPLASGDADGVGAGDGESTPLVSRVDGAVDRAAWVSALLRGFFEGPGEPPEGMAGVMEATAEAVSAGASAWLARLAGAPAGGATLIVNARTALFAGDATPAPFRRRGVQTALIRARLAEGARLGCDLAAVCTQPGSASQRNYERAGFRLAYARTLMVREPLRTPESAR